MRKSSIGSVFLAFLLSLGGVASIAWAAGHLVPPLIDLPHSSPGWQEFMAYREALRWFGGAVMAAAALLCLCHLFRYGYHHLRPSGEKVKRYTAREVLLHALLALSFFGSWASSTYLILGKFFYGTPESAAGLPLGGLTDDLHIIAGLVFAGSLVLLAAIWRQPMRFEIFDLDWLKQAGGYFTGAYPILPAGRFNAGQKIWFVLLLALGFAVTLSGGLVYFHAWTGPGWSVVFYIVHTLAAVALSAGVIGHVYLTAVIHPHALPGMISGKVDRTFMEEDHSLEAIAREIETFEKTNV